MTTEDRAWMATVVGYRAALEQSSIFVGEDWPAKGIALAKGFERAWAAEVNSNDSAEEVGE